MDQHVNFDLLHFGTGPGHPLLIQTAGPSLPGGHNIDAEFSADTLLVERATGLLGSSGPPASAP